MLHTDSSALNRCRLAAGYYGIRPLRKKKQRTKKPRRLATIASVVIAACAVAGCATAPRVHHTLLVAPPSTRDVSKQIVKIEDLRGQAETKAVLIRNWIDRLRSSQ